MKQEDERSEDLTPEVLSRIAKAKREIEGMIDLYPQGMLLADEFLMLQRANRGLVEILGRQDFSEVLGKSLAELFWGADSGDDCPVEEVFRPEGAGGRPSDHTVDIPGRGARRLRFRVISAGESGEITAALVEDITDDPDHGLAAIKRERVNAAGEMVGALNHEINQSLGVIQGRAQLLMFILERGDRATDNETRQTLEDIVTHTHRIAEVLRKAMNLKDYVTKGYVGKVKIVNLEESTAKGDEDGEDTAADKA
ncbi:MAG: hypothetical protein JW909_06300 [Planctomycetes bacterium]|nr:hypothetical protein [Planctomycetota bacterium]